ncbi:MAG: EF-P beta-lysylation protein EpmB [Gammaproteobacteria bacterium SG8_47]|nr:MAG: EF-P beta-lysylation protein EpmB [Gammaproteobacteria bacterium SG8_47]
MIAETTDAWHTARWQRELAEAITDPAELLERLRLPATLLPAARAAAAQFPLRAPRGFVARIEPGKPNDPLLRQILPLGIELDDQPGYGPDPVGDIAAMPHPGLLHKYQGRVLLTLTGACAVHCRYCFRRHFPYAEANPGRGHWPEVLDYIRADASIGEVIFSGGDPLLLTDARLHLLLTELEGIRHVRRLRIHTRVPVVLPSRLDARFCSLLGERRLPLVIVVHVNHARELSAEVVAALRPLRRAGITLLNQAVLLRGVNDSAAALTALSEALFDAGVLPYYLHALDRVQGARHFDVDQEVAIALVAALRRTLPGYLVPSLVREIAGAPHKEALTSAAGTDTFTA